MKCIITPEKVIKLAFSPSDQITPTAIKETKIDAAQEQFIRPVLGEGLLQVLLEERYAKFLEDYILPALAYYVRYAIIPDLSLKLNNAGAQVFNGVHSSAATDKQRAEMRQQARADANALLDKAVRYIESHRDEFPEYAPEMNVRKNVHTNSGFVLIR